MAVGFSPAGHVDRSLPTAGASSERLPDPHPRLPSPHQQEEGIAGGTDLASAVVAALDHDVSGVLNVVDDDPTPIRDWLPEMAEALGAPRPRRLPLALVRLAAGAWGAAYLGGLRGADNTRARLVLGWRPRHRSWRADYARESSVRAV